MSTPLPNLQAPQFIRVAIPNAAKIAHNKTGAFGKASLMLSAESTDAISSVLTIGSHEFVLRCFRSTEEESVYAVNRITAFHKMLTSENFPSPLLGYDLKAPFVLFSHVPSTLQFDTTSEQTLVTLARLFGMFFGSHVKTCRPKETASQWLHEIQRYHVLGHTSYLNHLGILRDLATTQEILSSTSFDVWGLNSNSGTGTSAYKKPNFDYRPVGWEALQAGLALAQYAPHLVDSTFAALVEGWFATAGTGVFKNKRQLNDLIRIFVDLTPETRDAVRAARRERQLKVCEAEFVAEGGRPGAIHTTPYSHNRTSKVSKKDLAELTAHLHKVNAVEEADIDDMLSDDAHLNAAIPPDKYVSATCITCAGYCCTRGGKRHFAYLRPRDFIAFKKRNPEISGDAVVDKYLEYIPDKHITGGCLYQGKQGCTLPRDIRSIDCVNYLCKAATAVQKFHQETDVENAPVLFVAEQALRTVRRNVLKDDQLTQLTPKKSPAAE